MFCCFFGLTLFELSFWWTLFCKKPIVNLSSIKSNCFVNTKKSEIKKWDMGPYILNELATADSQTTLNGYSTSSIKSMWHKLFKRIVWTTSLCNTMWWYDTDVWRNVITKFLIYQTNNQNTKFGSKEKQKNALSNKV